MTTGVPPREHGVVANGFYWRDQRRVEMWTAWNDCIERPQIWDTLHDRDRARPLRLQAGEQDRGRAIIRTPLSAGMAYDIRVGSATIAPFVSMIGAYSNERDYVGGDRIATDSGWRLGRAAGMSLRFKEVVLAVSGVNRERGLPNDNRLAFSAGVSW